MKRLPRDFEVDVGKYRGVNASKIVSEELFGGAIRAQQKWQENLRGGVGALGSHGGAYVDTGEALNDITIQPAAPGHIEYVVGGDVVQLAVAEFGRRPGRAPPYDAIAAWARRKGLQPEDGQTFDSMVFAIQQAIAKNGLAAFAPAQRAADDVMRDLEARIAARIEREMNDAA